MMARPMQRPRWTKEEDQRLLECKSRNWDLSWLYISVQAGLNRSARSCRERWESYLDPKINREKFSQEEDDSIICFQSLYGNSWASIAAHLHGRTPNHVKNRWYNHLKEKKLGRSTGDQPHTTQPFHLNHNIDPKASASSSSIPTSVKLKKGNSMMARPVKKPRWTDEEDRLLFECRSQNPDQSWEKIAELLGPNRTPKSCWERYKNRRDPNVKREKFSQEEDDFIIRSQSLHGNKWASIAARLSGRTDNDVKNRWYNHLNKKKLGSSTGDQPHTTQLSHLNHNIDPKASSSPIPTLVSVSQEVVNHCSTFELAYPEGGYLQSDDETIHHSLEGDYFEFELTQLFHLNHNIVLNASSSSIPTSVSASEEIASISELAYPEFQWGYLSPWISGQVSASRESELMPTEEVTRIWSD